MAIGISTDMGGGVPSRQLLTPNGAMRQAWTWYICLLLAPFALFLAVVVVLDYRQSLIEPVSLKSAWFLASVALTIIIGPIAFAARSRLFRPYWRGESVNPRDYLRGMLLVWFAFEIGGLFSLVGCLMSNAMAPGIMPAIANFIFFAFLWPNGHAMVRPAGDTDDPEIYQEPR